MWYYESDIGTLRIVKTDDGKYGFLYNGIIWEASLTPEAEADNVYCRATGCDTWDFSSVEAPTDLREWIYLDDLR